MSYRLNSLNRLSIPSLKRHAYSFRFEKNKKAELIRSNIQPLKNSSNINTHNQWKMYIFMKQTFRKVLDNFINVAFK